MIEVQEYQTDAGVSPFTRWFDRLHTPAALKVRTAIARMEAGNLSNTQSVGGGVPECRIDFGPGYRVYFGRVGMQVIFLLGGGTKKRQQQDIAAAQKLWAAYKASQRRGS